MATPPRKGEPQAPPLPGAPPLTLPPGAPTGFADPSRRAASTAAYGQQLGAVLGDDVDVSALLDDEPTRPHQIVPPDVDADEAADERAVLEPVSEEAHPVRRHPTNPQLLSEALAAVASGRAGELELGEGAERAHTPAIPASKPIVAAPEPSAPSLATSLATEPPAMRAPEPKPIVPRSPSPVPLRVGLFSSDRPTHWLIAAAVGLLLAIVPARQLARSHAQELTTQPLLELKDAIDSPLAVDAGLLRKPQAIAAQVDAARGEVRNRYVLAWLLVGLGLGAGLGFVPRFWA